MSTMPVTGGKQHDDILQWVEELDSAVRKLRNGKLSITFGKKAESLQYLDSLRMVYEISAKSDSARSCRSALVEAIVSAEKRVPGSSYFALCGFIAAYMNKSIDLEKYSGRSQFMDIDELNRAVSKVSTCEITTTVVRAALSAAGGSGTIRVSRSDEHDIKLKVHEGYRFKSGIEHSFCQGTSISEFDFLDCDVALIDGVITAVSEIHHLLEHYSASKRRLCLFARGYEPEVIHTLAVNYLRGSLRVIPHRIPVSIDSINMLRDLGVCVGHDPISPLKGELVSSLKLDSIPSVRRISSNKNECTIENPERSKSVWIHARWLLEQAAQEQVEDKRKLFEDRAAGLNPAIVEICLGRCVGELAGLLEDRIRAALGIVNGFCLTGRISSKDIDDSEFVSEMLPKIGDLPAGSLINGMKIGSRLAETMKSIGAVIADDTRKTTQG